jgi:DNA-directed RNA polymerase specialized sigma24 family protein
MLKLRRISASHRDAFLERYKGLHAWAVQMTANDQALAEDLLHDLFILFTLSQPDLRRIENLDNYLYASLRNLHISQLRRTTRARFEQLSVIEYESARLSLHSVAHGRDLIQAQDELRRICQYACIRKETANAASVLILRFFHGYYPTEIAKVTRRTRKAADKRLTAARVEAKAFLENSQSLAFINGPSQPATPEVFPVRFARTLGDFLFELQETIFQSRSGECLDREQLKHLYDADRPAPIARRHLAHIVSCPTCLNRVNALLGLPLLNERYPTDTMDKDSKKGGGPPDSGDKGGAVRKLKDWEREAREAFEHKPQELCVSVNGYLLGSQLIGSELSELTLNVAADERISFCEVFSEQGIRLMMMNVEELPPNGPGELHQRVELSESRSLESSLLFSNPFPTVHVSYHDPALATVPSAQEDEVEPDDSLIVTAVPEVKVETGDIRPRIKDLPHKVQELMAREGRRFLNTRFWMRPGVVTALVAALLVAAALFIEFRRVTPVPSAAELLQQSALVEEALANDRNQALHRTINVEEKNSAGASIALRRVEVWQSAERGISARRLYDDKGALLAGDWRRSDGVETLYAHGVRPQIKPVPEACNPQPTALNFDNAWQVLPSAKELNALLGVSGNVTVEERPAEYLISYSRADQTASGLLKATLVLNRADLHATRQTLSVRQGTEVREYSMVEASFERVPATTTRPSVFEPDAELLPSGESRAVPTPDNEKKVDAASQPIVPSPVTATPALEVEVLRLLNQAGADMGEQISVTRNADGRLSVEGLTETQKRKQELLDALNGLRSNPAVKIDIQTLDEALARQPKGQNSSGPISFETSQPSSNTLPVDKELRQYFAARNVSEAQTDEAIHQFASRVIRRSLQIVKHARALKMLAERFSPEELQTLDADAKSKWLLLITQHAQALQQESAAMRRGIGPLFPFASQSASESAVIKSDADLARAAEHLFQMCSENDRVILSAFSISSDSSKASSIKSVTFWRSLQEAETLAVRISDFRF